MSTVCIYLRCVLLSQTAKALGLTSIMHPPDTFMSDRCLIDVDPKVSAIWDVVERKTTLFDVTWNIAVSPKWNIEISSAWVVHGNAREETIDVVKQNRNHNGTFLTFLCLHLLQYYMIHNSGLVISSNEFNNLHIYTHAIALSRLPFFTVENFIRTINETNELAVSKVH